MTVSTFKWRAIPRSKAKNAYDLLNDVANTIGEEPARYAQGDWMAIMRRIYPSYGTALVESQYPIPTCGTIACVAGWTVALMGNAETFAGSYSYTASKILGISGGQADDLFDGSALSRYTDDGKVPEQGSRAYAELGVHHIRRFMAEHEEQLKAHRLPSIKRGATRRKDGWGEYDLISAR